MCLREKETNSNALLTFSGYGPLQTFFLKPLPWTRIQTSTQITGKSYEMSAFSLSLRILPKTWWSNIAFWITFQGGKIMLITWVSSPEIYQTALEVGICIFSSWSAWRGWKDAVVRHGLYQASCSRGVAKNLFQTLQFILKGTRVP